MTRNRRTVNDVIEDTMGLCLSLWALATSCAAYKMLQHLYYPQVPNKPAVQSHTSAQQENDLFVINASINSFARSRE